MKGAAAYRAACRLRGPNQAALPGQDAGCGVWSDERSRAAILSKAKRACIRGLWQSAWERPAGLGQTSTRTKALCLNLRS